MISFFEAALASLAIHRVGNRLNEEGYVLSEAPLAVQDELLNNILMQYFVTPFTKTNEVYRFYHASDDLNLNAVYHFAEAIFDDPAGFHEGSTQIAKYLYEAAAHPKIKGGELYLALFRNLQIEGELLDAIGIFKSETKETPHWFKSSAGRLKSTHEKKDSVRQSKIAFQTRTEFYIYFGI